MIKAVDVRHVPGDGVTTEGFWATCVVNDEEQVWVIAMFDGPADTLSESCSDAIEKAIQYRQFMSDNFPIQVCGRVVHERHLTLE